MHFSIKAILFCSALVFGGCQLTKDSNGFYIIEKRKPVTQSEQHTEGIGNIKKTNDGDKTVSMDGTTHQQNMDMQNSVNTSKYIEEPDSGGLESKDTAEKKLEEAILVASTQKKARNRFVVKQEDNDGIETEKDCNCKCNDDRTSVEQKSTAVYFNQNEKMLYIQVGAYSRFNDANNFADKLRKNGINDVKVIDEAGKAKVIIGGFNAKADGQKTIDKLYSIGVYDYFWKVIK